MKVKAKKLGFYRGVRRREGDEFILTEGDKFNEVWMEVVDKNTVPLKKEPVEIANAIPEEFSPQTLSQAQKGKGKGSKKGKTPSDAEVI